MTSKMNDLKRLSILVCSIQRREKQLTRLMNVLNPQMKSNVEVLVETDDGQMSIGAKRNKLLSLAQGDYVAFVDDDDLVSLDYVDKILNAASTSPDCCSLTGEIDHVMSVRIGRNRQRRRRIKNTFVHSIKHDHWYEKNGVYFRNPNHLNAIKRELTLRVGFPEIDSGEDADFSMKIFSLLKTEVEINGIIYYYLAS